MGATLRAMLPRYLQHHLISARELACRRATTTISCLPTAITGFDHLLVGGLPRGQLVELVGHRSSGRFSTLLSLLAATTAVGKPAALVDLGDGLDPRLAAVAGADLERLLWLRPLHLKSALLSTEMLITGGFPLVVLDLGSPPVPGGRGAEAAWRRLARAAESHAAALLVSSPYRVSGTAATSVVKAEPSRARWSGSERGAPPLLLGLSSRLTLEKLRGQPGTASETICFILPEAATFGTEPPRDPWSAAAHRPRSASAPPPSRASNWPRELEATACRA
jgi:hypothetical protein